MNNKSQFSLRTVLIFVTLLCVLLALTPSTSEFVKLVAGYIVAANVLGLAVGWLVTYVFKMPRDGGYRHNDQSSE